MPDVTRLGLAENEDGVTETMRPSRTAIDWVRWWPSSRKPHAPVSAGVPNTANENRSEERWPAPLPLAASTSCSVMTFFVLARPAGDNSVAEQIPGGGLLRRRSSAPAAGPA